jgi:FtsP/CotA-like multicopper oxidase with cupredoxin domain
MRRLARFGWILPLVVALSPVSEPRIAPNDNRVPGGASDGASLTVHLVVQRGEWYPEAENGPHLTVAAFAEEGKAPSIPGPLLRVKTGTVVRARVRNGLADSAIHVIGLATQPIAAADTLHLAPGDTREVTFRAGTPGTYYYRAVVGRRAGDGDEREHETAGGAFVVDPPGGSPPDRIFVMNIFAEPPDSTGGREALAINGRSWPHTERLGLVVGDTARWRVINGTVRPHPMHLHGFYFRIDAKGDGLSALDVPAAERSLGVTEYMRAWTTRTFTWSPDRPGNWLFHCHLTFHVVPDVRLGHTHAAADADIRETTSMNPMRHMAGLVLGIEVAPRPGETYQRTGPARRLDLFVNEGKQRGRMPRTFSYILQQGSAPPPTDSVSIPGSLIVLAQGEPTDITIHNRATEPMGIHWHGLELESWSDGVVGWSGIGAEVAPPIMPADSFTARLTLPRAGTFIYHTHLNDIEQVTGGAIGPLVVLEPGRKWDPARDHVYIGGWSGLDDVTSPGCVPPQSEPKCWPRLMVNGDTVGLPPLTLEAGVKHRFRFINLSPAENIRYSLRRDTTVISWMALAKDGADLPRALRVARPATQGVSVGETFDFEVTPPPGELVLTAGFTGGPPTWRRRLIVR